LERLIDPGYTTERLHGGSVGFVELMTGTIGGEPFRTVVKTQKRWDRPGDPDSWRREYDLYASDVGSDLDAMFSYMFRRPKCYHAQMGDNETKLWLEYIEGVSGSDLTAEMLESVAEGLGRFQGKLYAEKSMPVITNLSSTDGMKDFYYYNRSKKELYDHIRSVSCEVPTHLCEMLIDVDERADDVWAEIEKFPLVLCHRDLFPPNIFYADGSIVLIDWDSAGMGYLGEDIVNLVADAGDVAHMVEYFCRCVPAYLRGFGAYVDVSQLQNLYIYERIVMHFGYRSLDKCNWLGIAKTADEMKIDLDVLQQIFEMRHINIK